METLEDYLRVNILFESLDDDIYKGVKGSLTEHRFPAGKIILEENSEGQELYLIAEGRVKVVKYSTTGEEKLLALLHVGDFFGELELIDGRNRSARVVAVEDCTLFSLNKNTFLNLLNQSHPFALRVMQVLSLRLRATDNHFISELEKETQRIQKEFRNMEQLIEATKIVNSTLDLDKLLKLILDTALRIVDGDRGTLYLLDRSKQELWSKIFIGTERVTIRLPLGKGIAGYVAATGETINIIDAYLDPRFNPDIDRRTGYHTQTILCMPLRNKENEIVGVLQMLNKRNGNFSRDDENFIRALSIHAAIAIDNARLYEAEKEYQQMREEIRLAAKIQHELLPKETPIFPGYDIAGRYLPAKLVGGDCFDFIQGDKTKLVLCLGDVSGKGLPASLLMANVQATLRGQALAALSPKTCIVNASKLLFRSTASDKFVTLFYGLLDINEHMLFYCNAGHDNPMLFNQRNKIKRLKTGGVVLGIMDDFPYKEKKTRICPGDLLVIYSDGIVEAMNRKGDFFGEERLIGIIQECRNFTAPQIIDKIFGNVLDYMRGTEQWDDMTMVVVKRYQ
jgi:serine phosphatase RsbU (regulator of sigma subunit)/CRP-like cAMP-binding protein